ncbi:MAG: hypothetical protein ABIS50_25955 [Luteolibacter sp.]|uniref:hypothetical protein n=1 Tax=Luteolibacter sp. TaxID=1962973 RepID=UPI003266456D
MKSKKIRTRFPLPPTAVRRHPRGFALIVTLSLMILLTVIAVGLLTLSSISLRSSSQNDAMQTARANARVALMLAIGDLQKQLGPDTRISATADQVTGSDPSVSTTPQTQRQWAGVYNSWLTALPNAQRPTPQFLQWFVSGDPTKVTNKDYAGTAISTNSKDSVEIVTANSVGPDSDPVRVPLLTQTTTNGVKSSYAWWVSDLGTKGLIAPANAIPTAIADARFDQQAVPSYNLKAATTGKSTPFGKVVATDPLLANVVSLQSSSLLADKPTNVRGFYHDFTAQSRGLITNVRKGGFRKDLSMELERPTNSSQTPLPLTNANNVLYKVQGENGINLQELWAYYNLYSTSNTANKGMRRAGTANFTTGGSMTSGTPYLQLEGSAAACREDDWFYFKQPVIISYQLVLSFQTRPTSTGENLLHIVADPIITFWNPLDVPVVVPQGVVFTVKYWSVPYDLSIKKNGQVLDCPIASISKADSNFLSLEVGALQQLVFKPGEVIKMSQSGNILAKGTDIHALAGSKGFLFGNGVAIEAMTRDGVKVTIAAGDTLTYASAKPNNLTAGATGSDGHVLSGGNMHTRHFSLTHHEYYVGKDRGADSLGIGGMFLDWDFGNKRLKFSDPIRLEKKEETPGTKSPGDRYYADQRPNIFKPFTDGRTIPTSGAKMPFMLFSFNAKTEANSGLGTRGLSRFNPKALHVDFYDLKDPKPAERDWLPYEYTVEALNGWKSQNDSLQVDTTGRGYFGGAMNASDGTSFVTTHSVPREPIVSLAAFQNSFANGFEVQRPRYGYATLNAREPLLPQISHAIGNSMAPSMMPKGTTEGTLPGGRPMADHSYLANQALWDDWFLSGIAPQNVNTFSKPRPQKQVAKDFFEGTTKLPVARYVADLRGQDPTKLAATYFSSTIPTAAATNNIASLIRVDGMFNVNSTSVEAWKSLLGARKDRPVLVRDANGKESVQAATADVTPVSALLGPLDKSVAQGSGNFAMNDAAQWVGRRALKDDEIDRLARGIVKEVRKRGPFLCLSDFINRRVGSDVDLARAGAIQNALDSADTKINDAYQSGGRGTNASARFPFPEAEQGPMSQGIPGIVKQADILTPIAPILSARSDSFLVRAYGEKTDATGKVIARAWCEAVVQRSATFIDSADAPEKTYTTISTLNKTFGRRFEIVSFRWLNASEA